MYDILYHYYFYIIIKREFYQLIDKGLETPEQIFLQDLKTVVLNQGAAGWLKI